MRRVRRISASSLLAGVLLGSSAAYAGDLAAALRFTRDVMGEEAIEGYEAFIDDDPNEALALLLARDVEPGRPPSAYEPSPRRHPGVRIPPFRRLGRTRLDYASLAAHIDEAARQTGLPPALIDAVIRTESGYRPRAVSRAGAVGLMQLMPRTARAMGVRNPYDPRQNVLGGSRYLRKMYDRFGDIHLAIAAYNAGPGNVAKHGGIPPFRETRRYVRVVMDRFRGSPLRDS
jgi:soluble lytic murein transglycosylase-like protein